MMHRFFLALGAAVVGGALLAGGPALAGGNGKWGKYFYGDSVSTSLTFCEAGNAAVFPATNVGKRDVRVTVECVDGQGDPFPFLVDLVDGKPTLFTCLLCLPRPYCPSLFATSKTQDATSSAVRHLLSTSSCLKGFSWSHCLSPCCLK